MTDQQIDALRIAHAERRPPNRRVTALVSVNHGLAENGDRVFSVERVELTGALRDGSDRLQVRRPNGDAMVVETGLLSGFRVEGTG